ncbi:MAG TPA: hypothetical protein VNA20_17870 [Frankiaceae bacterium]|nr:hypothetical protein [Frankiaceae bacterium]
MSTETRLRTALREIAEDGTPAPDLWRRLSARRPGHRPWRPVVAAAAVAAAVAVAVVVTPRRTPPPPVAPVPSATVAPNPLRATIPVENLHGLVVHEGALWGADAHRGDLVRIDVATRDVRRFHLFADRGERFPRGLVMAGRVLWTGLPGRTVRVDPDTGRTLGSSDVGVGDNVAGLGAAPGGGIWVLDEYGKTAHNLDARGRLARSVPLGKQQMPFAGVAVGHGAVWVQAAGGSGEVVRIALADDRVSRFRLPAERGFANFQGNIAVTDDAVWFESGDTLVRVDPATSEVTGTVRLPDTSTVFDLHGHGTTLWVAASGANALYRIDSRAARIVGSVGVASPGSVATDGTRVWVTGEDGVREYAAGLIVEDLA